MAYPDTDYLTKLTIKRLAELNATRAKVWGTWGRTGSAYCSMGCARSAPPAYVYMPCHLRQAPRSSLIPDMCCMRASALTPAPGVHMRGVHAACMCHFPPHVSCRRRHARTPHVCASIHPSVRPGGGAGGASHADGGLRGGAQKGGLGWAHGVLGRG